eukprot:GDKH01004507.1.p2 GENE.GDKH01004507.1~~GDKH01004507.1.p2  ORF type:complete len:50 (-),score=5.51 GDKH01004507.1:309-458(-)
MAGSGILALCRGVALEYKTRKGNTAHTFFEVVLSPRPQGLKWRKNKEGI